MDEKNYEEILDLIRQEFDAWLLELAQQHGQRTADLSFLRKHYLPTVKYSTLAQIARGETMPSLVTAIKLIRARPGFGAILDLRLLPDALKDNPVAQQITAGLADPHLTDADLAEIAAQVEALRVKRRNHNPLMSGGAA